MSMISRDGKDFAWGESLSELKGLCTESEKYVYDMIKWKPAVLYKEIGPLIKNSMSTKKRLGVKVPYTTRKTIMQVPTDEDLRTMLALQIRGRRKRITSIKNQFHNTMTRKTEIFVEEEKKYEVITEKVDKVPGNGA